MFFAILLIGIIIAIIVLTVRYLYYQAHILSSREFRRTAERQTFWAEKKDPKITCDYCVGYVLSSPENIRYLAGFLPEWNLSCLSSSVMKACAKITGENDFLPASVEFIRNERRFLVEGLKGLGLKVYDSDTVFVLFRCESGADLYTALLDKKILIRDCADFPGLGKGYYRAAVRCREDNERLIKAIGELLR